jgi:predicted dehydrogenase
MKTDKVWIIGAGAMTREYLKVLKALGIDALVIGRSQENCQKIKAEFGCDVLSDGLTAFLQSNPIIPLKAIVAVGIEALKDVTIELLNFGVKHILLEKPGVAYVNEINELAALVKTSNAQILLAYNRRFYASVLKAEELIKEDGGISSFNFEFTEWSHIIRTLHKTKAEWHNWFLGNSTHVVDTAFFLGGKPEKLSAYYNGTLDWHPASANFCGAGISTEGALFSYHANWEAPGRWVIEILTKKRRFLFKPMESLQVQILGSLAVNPVELDDALDKDFKPGLFLQTESFIRGDYSRFCNIEEQYYMIRAFYTKMSGYGLHRTS